MKDRKDGLGSGTGAKTLTDDQIKTRPKIGRRSLLLSVGAGVAGGGTMLARPGAAQRVTDGDAGAYADPPGRGRGGTGCTDNDAGNYADLAGRGRGTGINDADGGAYADPAGCGRGGRSGGGGGPTDGDSGNFADPAGQGRGGVRTGLSDNDSGRWADPAGGGRWGSRLTDSDDGPYFSDQAGNGRRGW